MMKFGSCAFRLVCALAICSGIAWAPRRADAQEAASSTNAEQYRKAFAALGKKNWSEARDLLVPLWEHNQTWDVASALGQAEFKLKSYALGTRHMAFAVANVPPRENAKDVKRLQSALAQMKAAVGTVRISVSKDAAEVWADAQRIGISPLATETYLDPGTHLLEARLSDGGRGKETIEVVAGQSYEIALVIDKPTDETPRSVAPLVVPTSALHEAREDVATKRVSAPPAQPDNTQNWTPVFVTGGLAIVALAVGTGFAIDTNSQQSNAAKKLGEAEAQFGSNPCTPQKGATSSVCHDLQATQDRQDRSLTGAAVSFVASGVFAAAAVGSYFIWARPNESRVDAWVGPTGCGLNLKGNF